MLWSSAWSSRVCSSIVAETLDIGGPCLGSVEVPSDVGPVDLNSRRCCQGIGQGPSSQRGEYSADLDSNRVAGMTLMGGDGAA